MQKLRIVIFFLFCPYVFFAQQAPVNIDREDALFSVAKLTAFKEDKTWKQGLSEIRNDTSFVHTTQDIFKLGGNNPRNIWIKFQLINHTSKEIYFELSTSITDSVYLYAINPKGAVTTQRLGKYFDYRERQIQSNHQIFVLNGEKDELNTYYVNIRSQFPVSIRTRVGTHSAFSEEYHSSDLLHGLFIGIVMIVTLFNLLFFLSSRDGFYGYYTGYAIFIMLTVLRFDGYLFQYLYPHIPEFNITGFYFHGLAGIFGIFFSRSFLKTEKYTPRLDKGFNFFLAFYVFNMFLAAVGLYELNVLSVYLITFPFNLYLIFVGIQVYRSGYKLARYFIAGAFCLTVGVTVFSLYNMGFLGSNNLTRNIMYVAIAAESILFFMAIIDRFSVLREEKHEAQERMIESLQQNERLIKEKNRLLEKHAHNRAMQLELMQSQLSDYAQKLIKSNQELTDFAHIASHDLRAPIRNIGSFTQLLEKRINGQLDVRSKEYLDFIKSNVRQSTKLIEDLLNYSKIDKNIGEPLPVDLNNVLLLVSNNLQSFIIEKKAEIIAKDLPLLRGHISLFVQLFQNLINNGLKYNRSEAPTVTISADWVGNDLVFRVTDNGIGIPPQYQAQIFGMFRRLHSSAEYEGSGIGLAFCERIVSTYGGKIWLESEENKGTTFFFTLPNAIEKENCPSENLTILSSNINLSDLQNNTEGYNQNDENVLNNHARSKSHSNPSTAQPVLVSFDNRTPEHRVISEPYPAPNSENAERFSASDLEKLLRKTAEKRFSNNQPPSSI